MRVHLHPQRRTVEIAGRRMVGRLLSELGVLPNTAMVIRRDELLTDGEFVEDDEEIEIRAVISGGAGDVPTPPSALGVQSLLRSCQAYLGARPSAAARTRIGGRPRSGRPHGRSQRVRPANPPST